MGKIPQSFVAACAFATDRLTLGGGASLRIQGTDRRGNWYYASVAAPIRRSHKIGRSRKRRTSLLKRELTRIGVRIIALILCAARVVSSMETSMTGSHSTRCYWRTVAGATFACLFVQSAVAADLGSGPPGILLANSPWTLTFTPYAWAPFIQGDATVRERTAN